MESKLESDSKTNSKTKSKMEKKIKDYEKKIKDCVKKINKIKHNIKIESNKLNVKNNKSIDDMEITSNKIFLNNKSALLLAFDEVIGKNTQFEGNYDYISIRETKDVLEFIIENKCFTDNINIHQCAKFLDIVNNTLCFNIFDKSYKEFFLLVSWNGT